MIEPEETIFMTVDLRDFMSDGIVREKAFREQIARHDWSQYRDEKVLVKACAGDPVPPWAFMLIMTRLMPVAGYIGYGEACSATTIFKASEAAVEKQ